MVIIDPRVVEEGIFVYGSNEAGRSFTGSAHTAVEKYGAQLGISYGRTGQAFAIPTMDSQIQTLPLKYIKNYINQFLKDASKPSYTGKIITGYSDMYMVTRIGCGKAGYTDADIAPLFECAGSNILFDVAWKPYLGGIAADLKPRGYWGSNLENAGH